MRNNSNNQGGNLTINQHQWVVERACSSWRVTSSWANRRLPISIEPVSSQITRSKIDFFGRLLRNEYTKHLIESALATGSLSNQSLLHEVCEIANGIPYVPRQPEDEATCQELRALNEKLAIKRNADLEETRAGRRSGLVDSIRCRLQNRTKTRKDAVLYQLVKAF